MPFSKQLAVQIQGLFESAVYQQGRVLQQANNVSHLQKSPHISAQVNDPQAGICKTFISIHQQGELLQIDGECSCEQEFNCSHVAATLLQYIETDVPAKNSHNILQAVDSKISDTYIKSVNIEVANTESITKKKLHYVLSLQEQKLVLHLFLVSDEITTAYTAKLLLKNPPRFIQSQDLQLFQLLADEHRDPGGSGIVLNQNSDVLIKALIQTGSCHWLNAKQPPLKPHSVKSGKWYWQQYADGKQRLVVSMKDETLTLLPTLPLLYLDCKQHCIGLVTTGFLPRQDQQLFELPAFHVGEIYAARKKMPLKQLADRLPQPLLAQTIYKKQVRPQAGLQLRVKEGKSTKRNNKNGWLKKEGLKKFKLELKLEFHYPGWTIHYNEPGSYVGQFSDDGFIQWQRDTEFELSMAKQLQTLGWSIVNAQKNNTWTLAADLNDQAAASFLVFDCPQLLQQNWRIQYENCPDILQMEQLRWQSDFSIAANHRQIYLSIRLVAENVEPINFLNVLAQNLKREWIKTKELSVDGHSVLATENKQLIVIANRHLKPVLDCLLELNAAKPLDKAGDLLLSRGRFQAVHTLLNDLARELNIHIKLPVELDKRQHCKVLQLHKTDESAGVNAQLRAYQQQGVDWLHALFQHQLGGVLADDMGLGKTLQILAFLWQCKCRGQLKHPVLILAPTSVLSNWKSEIQTFTPGLKTLLLHGPQRHQYFQLIDDNDLIITSYPLLIRDLPLLLEHYWQMLILDEAQAIKNANSLTSNAVREFNATINICMSGTPVENHLGELWALFDFTLPGLLGAKQQFNDWFRYPIESRNDAAQHDLLVERISPVMLRRSKAEVLPQLPEKVYQSVFIELSDSQQQIYETVHQQMSQSLRDNIRCRGLNASRMHILDALTRLRQICCDPRLLPGGLKGEFSVERLVEKKPASSKMNYLLDMLDEMLEQGRKILLFSQFTSLLSLLEGELKRKNINYALLTGQTRKRDEQIKRFQQGQVPLFLISLKAGGSGLNLTQADTVIHYDPWWNPATENQATDRAHRIGQNKSVMVYKLIAANTIEEKIVELQKNKQNIADNLLQGASQKNFNSRDLNSLLQLLEIEI